MTTEEETIAARVAANIHHIINGFDDRYDTVVGERGYRLSRGRESADRHCRVLLRDPPVVLLDEVTSALGTVSERVVQQALSEAAHDTLETLLETPLSNSRLDGSGCSSDQWRPTADDSPWATAPVADGIDGRLLILNLPFSAAEVP